MGDREARRRRAEEAARYWFSTPGVSQGEVAQLFGVPPGSLSGAANKLGLRKPIDLTNPKFAVRFRMKSKGSVEERVKDAAMRERTLRLIEAYDRRLERRKAMP